MKPSYEATRERLYELQHFGIHLGLDTISSLLSELGNPHWRVPVLHVAGTNGKGSVAAVTASILQAAGLRVGLYTSPHLLDFRERIQIRGQCISEGRVVELFDTIRSAALICRAADVFRGGHRHGVSVLCRRGGGSRRGGGRVGRKIRRDERVPVNRYAHYKHCIRS